MDATQLSKAKRALLEKYVRGNRRPVLEASGIEKRTHTGPLPLSFGQQQLWLLAQLMPDALVYNECVTLHLSGPLNIAVFEKSFNEILKRHEAWCTSFPVVNEQPVQYVHPYQPISLPFVDMQHLAEQERESEALRLATKDASRPFDLAHGPLLRPLLIRLSDTDTRLFLTLHHIIFDGFSLYQIFLPEIYALYEAFLAELPSPLSDLPIRYVDFAVWQREQVQPDVLTSHMEYWKKQLAGAPTTLELPTDRPRPQTTTYRGAMHTFAVSKQVTNALKELSLKEGVTLFMMMVAAFQTLLYRYTGQQDILLGTTVSDRRRPEVQQLIGFFLNTLVLRTDVSQNPSFRMLLQQVRAMTLEAQIHQDVPFESLVKQLQPERNLGQNPLFQVMIALEPPLSTLPSGWTLTQMDIKANAAKFDLYLELDDRPEGLVGRFEYNTDLFDKERIVRMTEHWQTLLEGIVATPEKRVSELPILTPAEQLQVVVEWNATQTPYPNQYVHSLFEVQVARAPDAVALIFEEQQMTYAALNMRANQLAHYLQRKGVERGIMVGLCMDRSLDMVVSLLAILKAGGAYVPLDPTYPQERLTFMLDDTKSNVLVTQEQFVDILPVQGRQVVCLTHDWTAIAQEPIENLTHEAEIDDLAYVMYTSGSTGRPKGVEIRHRSIIRLLFGVDYVPLDSTRVLLHMAPISFDASTFEVWGALLHGARCVLFPERLPTPQRIGAIIREHHITTLWLTASLFNAVIDEAPEALRGTKHVLTGGEALSVAHIRRALTLFPETQLINGYGPTESTTFTCCHPIPRHLPASTRSIPIGRPIGNTHVYVLDHFMNPVPIGVVGELYIGGDGLAKGYLHRPELTAERFIPHPFSNRPGARLYKTGDLVRYLPDGAIEFLGRQDQQIKLRGFRIELGEIEVVLDQHPAIREALVITREDNGTKRLIAYLVLQSKHTIAVSEIRRFVKERLPEYMLPTTYVLVDAFLRTPNGKVDYRALPSPSYDRPALEETFVASRSTIEDTLASIWAQVLRLDKVGVHDNFFELGGDSILSIQILARAHRAGLQLTPKDMFQHQTIAALATVAKFAPIATMERETRAGSVPFTPIQHMFFEQKLKNPHHWNQAWLFEVHSIHDVALLEQSIQHVLRYHDVFHYRFGCEQSGWQQYYAPQENLYNFRRVDLSRLSLEEHHACLAAEAATAQNSLNIEYGPLVNVVYFTLGPVQPARLLFVIHHLVIDGVSWRILLDDIETVYKQLQQGATVEIPAKTASFQQWAERLVSYTQSDALQQELAYWLHMPPSPVSPVPVDYITEPEQRSMAFSRIVNVSLSIEETRTLLHRVPKAYHTKINDVLLTALLQAFVQWTGEHALLLDLEGHGRELIDEQIQLTRTIGWFTTVFPVYLQQPTSSFVEALKAVKEQLRTIPHNGIGYGVLRYLGKQEVRERLKMLPQAQVSFNYLGQFDQSASDVSLLTYTQEDTGPVCNAQEMQHYLLEVSGLISNGQLQISWLYNERVHRRSTIEQLVQSYLEVLRALILHCQSPASGEYTPSDFPLAKLDGQELTTLLSSVKKAKKMPPR